MAKHGHDKRTMNTRPSKGTELPIPGRGAKVSFPALGKMRSQEQWTKARAIILLRLTLVIATSYLLLVQGPPITIPSTTMWLITFVTA